MTTFAIVIFAVLLALFASFLNARSLTEQQLETNGDLADKYLSVLTAIYGIFLAFVISTLWAADDRVVGIVSSEASEIVYVGSLTLALDPADRIRVLDDLDRYGCDVVKRDWEEMSTQRYSNKLMRGGAYDTLWKDVLFTPAHNPVQTDARSRLMDALHSIGDLRRTRLLFSEDHLSGAFKWIIVLGAAATLLPLILIARRGQRYQVVCSLCCVSLIVTMVCLVFDLNDPYTGPIRITPEPLKVALNSLSYWRGNASVCAAHLPPAGEPQAPSAARKP